jgi:formylmethanofuran dehydrogenase subunit C
MSSFAFLKGINLGLVGGSSRSTMMSIGNSTVTINGRKYTGQSISTDGSGRIFVDGRDVSKDEGETKDVVYKSCVIRVEGNVAGSISASTADVEVSGSVGGSVSTASGSVYVEGDIKGSSGAQSMSGNVTVEGNNAGPATSMSGNVSVRGERPAKRRRIEKD